MNNEKMLKKKIEKYLLSPLVLIIPLVVMCICLFPINRRSGIIASIVVFVVVVIQVVMYIITKAGIMPALVRFALEQGQIQKELLKELAVPYALLDSDGRILWANNMFVDTIGEGSRKRIRRNISYFFPEIGTEVLAADSYVNMDLEFNQMQFMAQIKKINFDEVFENEDALVDSKGETLIAMYLFDVTELKQYKRENFEQKLVAGLL